jgi:hypothetical protein
MKPLGFIGDHHGRDRGPDDCAAKSNILSARLVELAVIAVGIAVRLNHPSATGVVTMTESL